MSRKCGICLFDKHIIYDFISTINILNQYAQDLSSLQ